MQAIPTDDDQAARALNAHAINKAYYLVIDIETGNPPAEVMSRILAEAEPGFSVVPKCNDLIHKRKAAWRAPAGWKDKKKIAERQATDFQRIQDNAKEEVQRAIDKRESERKKVVDKAALLDLAPVLCIGLKTDKVTACISGMTEQRFTIPNIDFILSYAGEREMLLRLRDWLNDTCDISTEIVNHNLFGFDLPKLRNAYVRHRLFLPEVLQPSKEQPMLDTMKLITYFSRDNNGKKFVSLDDTCAALNVDRPKTVISGADVPAMFEAGQYEEIITYCAIDALATAECFQIMTGIHKGLN